MGYFDNLQRREMWREMWRWQKRTILVVSIEGALFLLAIASAVAWKLLHR